MFMYNFRYHLVTIVSIFAALAIGLLLGVALTGSDLVRDASSNLAQSLTEQFDELNRVNRELTDQLEDEQLFASQLAAGWQKDRLKGRTVVLLTRTTADGDNLVEELGSLITRNGGIPVLIRINSEHGFGLTDEQLLSALQEILPKADNEDYEVTLARALAQEWSFTYKAFRPPTAASTATGTPGASGTSGTTGLSGEPESGDIKAQDDDDESAVGEIVVSPPATPLGTTSIAVAFDSNYPLTTKLVEAGYLEVTVSYRPILDTVSAATEAESEALATQKLAYQQAQNQQLPYSVNGIINTAVYWPTGSSLPRLDQTALCITQQFDLLGEAGMLPYLLFDASESHLAGELPSEQLERDLSYYALLVQQEKFADTILPVAEDNNLSCVLSPQAKYRNYSVIALLTGASRGVYGVDTPGVQPFPSIPADNKGNAPFERSLRDFLEDYQVKPVDTG
ncbi:MAG: copper transporter [Coriobacteriia bacterium]|nr:copper transporter [Coriobacteriia bacterium]